MKMGVSVIIPTYNREKYIKQAITSVLLQDFEDTIEIIISDDGSTDDTLNIAKSFGDKVLILRKPEDCTSQGASGARNRGIKVASQPYICFLDSDDYYLPNHLKQMKNEIESKANLGFVFCRALEIDETKSSDLYSEWTKGQLEPKDLANLGISSVHVAHTNGFMFKKNVFDKVGYFNENIRVGEDSDMWMRVNEIFKCSFSNHFGTVIRKHSMEQLTDLPKESLLEGHYFIYRSAIKRYYKLKLKDKYRLKKLFFLSAKYKISQWPVFSKLYHFVYLYNKNNKVQKWYPLSYYLNLQE